MVKNLIRLSVVLALFVSVVPCEAAAEKLFYVKRSGAASTSLGGVGGIKTPDDVERVQSLVNKLNILIEHGPQAQGFNFDSFVEEFRKVAQVDGNEGAPTMGGKRTRPLFAREQVRGKPGALTRDALAAAQQLRDSLNSVLADREADLARAAAASAAISVAVPPAPSTITQGIPFGAQPTMDAASLATLSEAIRVREVQLEVQRRKAALAAANQPASPTTIANDPTPVAAAMFAPAPSAPSATAKGPTNAQQTNSSSNSRQASGAGSLGAQTPPTTTKVKKKRGKGDHGAERSPVPAKPTRSSYATVELPTTCGTGWLAAGATGTVASSAALAHFLKQGGYDKILRWLDKQERAKMSKEEKALVKATGLSSGSLLASLLMLARGGVLRRRYNRINTRKNKNRGMPFSIENDGSLSDVMITDGDEAYLKEVLTDLKKFRDTGAIPATKDLPNTYRGFTKGEYNQLRSRLGHSAVLPDLETRAVSSASMLHPEYAGLEASEKPAVDNLIAGLADALISQKQSRGTGWLATGGAGAAVSVPTLIHFLKKGGYKKALKLLSKKERALMSDEDKMLAWKTSGSAAAALASLAALARGGSLRRSHRKAVEAASAA